MKQLKHTNDKPLLEIYGKHNDELFNNRQGPIVTFNVSILLYLLFFRT